MVLSFVPRTRYSCSTNSTRMHFFLAGSPMISSFLRTLAAWNTISGLSLNPSLSLYGEPIHRRRVPAICHTHWLGISKHGATFQHPRYLGCCGKRLAEHQLGEFLLGLPEPKTV